MSEEKLLSCEIAERHVKARTQYKDLSEYTVMHAAAAEIFKDSISHLCLDGLTRLTVGAAEALAEHKGELELNGLTSLSDEKAEILSKHNGSLGFSGLTQLSNARVNIDEDTLRDIGSMDEWATMCGVQRIQGFQLSRNEECSIHGLDYSVMTTEDIPAGTPVLSVPADMILSSSQIRSTLEGYVNNAEEMLHKLQVEARHFPQFYLVLKILIEYEKG